MVTLGEKLNTVTSNVLGLIDNVPFKVSYILHAGVDWQISFFEVNYQLHNYLHKVQYSIDSNGNWVNEGIEYPLYCKCMAIDISATPFTNTLAIKRLKLDIGESKTITVLYVDVIEHETRIAEQTYTRLDATTYKFETEDGSFIADIKFDEAGFVVDYPGLFERVYIG